MPTMICDSWLSPDAVPPLLPSALGVFVGEELEAVGEESAVDVVLAPFEAGVAWSVGPPDEGVASEPGATGKLAEAVVVEVATVPLAASLHANITAGTPLPPSK